MKLYLTIIGLCLSIFSIGQTEIKIQNASFSGFPAHSTTPLDWTECGTLGYSPSDLHGDNSDFFKVKHDAYHGSTYVGLIVRAEGSVEAIGQWLEEPMQRNVQYQFSIYLAKADNYISLSKVTMQEENFNQPAILRIWGGNASCEGEQLLAEFLPIDHRDWQEYTFELEPEEDWQYLTLEAYFSDENSFAYNGNLLLDNCSSLFPYGTIKLVEIIEYDMMNNEELLDWIVACKVDDANLSDTSILDVVYDNYFFDSKSNEIGLRDLVTYLDSTRIQHYQNVFKKIGLKKSIKIMDETIQLLEKEKLTTRDTRFLENCNDLFKKALITDKAHDKRLNYIRLHRTEVIELLRECDL